MGDLTQSQLNSMAKRINQALVQYEKTFGINSEAYRRYETQIKEAIGIDKVHISKSGHIAISMGKKLFTVEEQLKELDRPSNKVKGRLEEAENLLKKIYKEKHPRSKKPKKFSMKKIKETANKIASIPNFFDNEIGDLYGYRKAIPRVDELLSKLECTNRKKFTYSELMDIIDELQEIKKQYDETHEGIILSDIDIQNQRNSGGFII